MRSAARANAAGDHTALAKAVCVGCVIIGIGVSHMLTGFEEVCRPSHGITVRVFAGSLSVVVGAVVQTVEVLAAASDHAVLTTAGDGDTEPGPMLEINIH